MSNFQRATPARQAAAAAEAALCNGGYVRIYSGTQPVTGDTALSGNTLLATPRFGTPAFNIASGVATANAITSDTNIAATGVANFFRMLESDGVTLVGDGTCGNQTITLSAGAALSAVALTVVALTLPAFAGQDLWFLDATSGALKKAHVALDAAAGATSITVSALAAAIANGSAATPNMVLGSCSLQMGAIASISSLTLSQLAQGQ